jgi:hypothetical protein
VAGADDGHLQSGRPPPVKKPTTASSGSRFFKRKLENVPFDLTGRPFRLRARSPVEISVKWENRLNEPTTDRPRNAPARPHPGHSHPRTRRRSSRVDVRASRRASNASRGESRAFLTSRAEVTPGSGRGDRGI